jgi:hypothetical protein
MICEALIIRIHSAREQTLPPAHLALLEELAQVVEHLLSGALVVWVEIPARLPISSQPNVVED